MLFRFWLTNLLLFESKYKFLPFGMKGKNNFPRLWHPQSFSWAGGLSLAGFWFHMNQFGVRMSGLLFFIQIQALNPLFFLKSWPWSLKPCILKHLYWLFCQSCTTWNAARLPKLWVWWIYDDWNYTKPFKSDEKAYISPLNNKKIVFINMHVVLITGLMYAHYGCLTLFLKNPSSCV